MHVAKTLAKLLRRAATFVDRTSNNIHESRFAYQSRFHQFIFNADQSIVDIGCGSDPFPFANTLVDLHIGPSEHRYTDLSNSKKPIVVADIHDLPFREKQFDFVYCCHVLEHVHNPVAACRELMRIGKRGFIETPTMMKDALFSWARGMHKWHVQAVGKMLCFTEYSERQLKGIDCPAFRDIVFSRGRTDMQDAYFRNLDLFNVMFTWETNFPVVVLRTDATVEHFCTEVESAG